MRLYRMALMVMLLATAGHADPGAHSAGPASAGVHFNDTSPFAASDEIARRMLTPLAFLKVQASLAQNGQHLGGQGIDPPIETFALSVPAEEPKSGYGLMVFVPPWEQPRLPEGWTEPLAKRGFILVSAGRSGNDANILNRRVPLALTAVANLERLYRIDRDRVFVAGFSGGSRIAFRLAVAYPDVFRGAILNAGSDPIGEDLPLPERSLLDELQIRSRLVFITGEADDINIQKDMATRLSMQDACVLNIVVQTMPHRGHELANSGAVEHALDGLSKSPGPDAAMIAACQAQVDRALNNALASARDRLDAGDRRGADHLLEQIDRRYGGLAAPTSVELYTRSRP